MNKKKRQNYLVVGGILVLVFIAVLVTRYLGLFQTLELKTQDFRFLHRGPIPHDDKIVVVSLDQESWESIPYDYPYPRQMWAKVIENLNEAGARLIVFDVQFDVAREDSAGDKIFAEAIRKAGNVILASKLNLVEKRGQIFTSITEPYKPFLDAALATGLIGELKDIDQYTRNYSIFYPYDGKYYLFLALKAVKEYMGIPDSVKMTVSPDSKYILYGPLRILHNPREINTMTINYYGPSKTFETFPLENIIDDSDVDLRGEADTDYMELWKNNSVYPPEILEMLRGEDGESPFKDKIVFIGDALEEHFDLKFTPFFNYHEEPKLTSGVETHAHAAQTILDANYIIHTERSVDNIIVLIMTTLTLLISVTLGPVWGIISLLAIVGSYIGISVWLFDSYNICVEWLPAIAGALMAYGLNTIYDFILEQREKKKIRGMFSTYMSPKILRYLEDHPDAFRLTGEKRESSIFFSDVEGFTTISESLSAEELALVLNKYLSPMTDILMKYDGYVDKYEGDAIMCDFGVPVEDPDHAWKACWAALDQQERLVSLREELLKDHNVRVKVRMGINSGLVSAGNMGSDQRFQYTVMGDAVNAASRFEGANKQYGTYLMIGEKTFKAAADKIEARVLDRLIVKGKNEYITVYHLLAKKGELSDEVADMKTHFENGMDHYWNRDFDAAIAEFRKALEIVEDDAPSKVFISRCEAFKETPPPTDWQGEFIMTTK